jgi:hypothetical protein
MSIVEQVERATAIDRQGVNRSRGVARELSQLEQLEEVEATLRSIGVTLEPVFDISLTARIGAVPVRK